MTDRETRALLRFAGYFSWGTDAWIHEDDLGTVLSTEDAVADAVERSKERQAQL
jgi:hypothetical protein